jgi:hypothetical protein
VDVMTEEAKKDSKPYVFVTDNLCVIVGLAGDESFEAVTKTEEK